MPEIIEEFLDDGVAKCIAFNRRGSLLAAGCADGSIVIWDFDTRGTSRIWRNGHRDAVTSVSWTKDGHYLVSSSMDSTVVQWKVLEGEAVCTVKLSAPAVSARVHPYDADVCVVSLANSLPPHLIRFSSKRQHPLPVATSLEPSPDTLQQANSAEPTTSDKAEKEKGTRSSRSGTGSLLAVATFSRRGDLVYVGSNKGTITVIDTASCAILDVVKVAGGSAIKGLVCNRTGTHL
eukprot:CAMPEP_0198204870 /NCGR_PEP_ID=MMETSP1445-20131203/8356_1 /TAXON_ID=36898 /ORGANISM="Pyramimonas sp., Strain CCMP2087" /LENGTH=233 /DNA_ID=CAMNT_0043876955 /DNA_START=355 /DNA_END=1052 /DNA_ORIENTATION=-